MDIYAALFVTDMPATVTATSFQVTYLLQNISFDFNDSLCRQVLDLYF